MADLSPISGTLGLRRAKHLLRRLTFGYDIATVNTFAGYNINTALEQLDLAPTNAVTFPPLLDWVTNYPSGEDVNDGAFLSLVKSWWLWRMYSDNTALEKLVFFLHTIITTKQEKVNNSRFLFYQNAMLRRYIVNELTGSTDPLSTYKELIYYMCIENSMLRFLDGTLNDVGRPNENFARELFELFTLGKRITNIPDDYGTFTENDIVEAAKVLTGWQTDGDFLTDSDVLLDGANFLKIGKLRTNDNGTLASRHDASTKNVFGRTIAPTEVINGRATVESATEELSTLIDYIFDKREAAEYIVTRLYRFFVYHTITPEIENDVIQPLATDFIDGGFRLLPVLRRLLMSRHFFNDENAEPSGDVDDDNYAVLFKSPIEMTFNVMQFFGNTIDEATAYDVMPALTRLMEPMNFIFMEPFDVAGYEPYHQSPNFQRNWITTNTLANRYEFVRTYLNGEIEMLAPPDLLSFVKDNPEFNSVATTDIDAFVERIVRYLFTLSTRDTELTPERLNFFKSELLREGLNAAPLTPEQFWAFQYNNETPDAPRMLQALFNAVLQTPEFQLG